MSQVQSENDELQDGYQEVQIGPEKLEIPEEWTVTTVSDVASRFISGGTPDSGNEDYWGGDIPWTTAAVVEGPQFDGEKDFITQEGLENSSSSLVPEGSILFGTRVNVANVGRTNKDIAISQDLTGIVLDESKVDPDFVAWYLMLNQPKIRDRYSQGSTIQGMLTDDLKSLPILYPSLPEQRRIADILSTVDEQIQQTDEMIHEKQELRKGLITELIRTGLDSHTSVRRRVGPKEYLIADGWELREVHELSTEEKKAIRGGPSGTQLKGAEYGTEGAKVYGQEHVSANDFTLGDKYLAEGEFSDFQSVEILSDDVLVTMMGTVGDSAVFPADAKKGIMDSHLLRIRPNTQTVVPEFLAILISESKIVEDQIKSLSHGLVMSGLNIGIVESLTVPIPPINEQQKFVGILSTTSESIDAEKSRLRSIKELKRGLMQDLLTGKVRVNAE